MKTLSRGHKSLGTDVTAFMRLRTLHNCLESGPIRVGYHPRRGILKNGVFQFCLFSENFTIPKDVALTWGLGKESKVNVQWECTSDRHPNAFATMAKHYDDGRRVGI